MTQDPVNSPGTAVWYFTGAAFLFALGPVLLGGGDPEAWQRWFTIIGLIVLGCGVVVFLKERRRRKGTVPGPEPSHGEH